VIVIAPDARVWKAENTRAYTETITVQNALDWFMPRNSITHPRLFTCATLATLILNLTLVRA